MTAAALAVAAIVLAAPASADLADGSYTPHASSPGPLAGGPWVFTSCGAGCKHVQNPMGGMDFHLDGDTWTATDPKTSFRHEVSINDGSLAGVDRTYLGNTVVDIPFTLSKN
ncbi:hypothetical protein PT015_17395 [Candidatus Mycobacterium wuenschmannii]|uniref:Secreted protein n=1 Tax=Candidatus Mycobacterium wuenschmannii TaxID=3027808 RepID=A0ABY8VV36_9MYCO|nr:hypothetical protein [Candidatus Mycobacterium wuenschmannii]WIM86654.1 hypothetical protein PT015_17395 [Candidatus Mycobacterium wuenschmannii]